MCLKFPVSSLSQEASCGKAILKPIQWKLKGRLQKAKCRKARREASKKQHDIASGSDSDESGSDLDGCNDVSVDNDETVSENDIEKE